MNDQQTTLAVALSCAVPLWIAQSRGLSPERRQERARELGRVVSLGEKHDEVRGQHGAGPALLANGELARGGNAGGPATVFNAVAEGLALAAFQPGGVTYLGLHWEASP